ncbi:MAG: nicotinate phosphoribosyltransferase [Anaerolineaceae bacterium]|nr:nicotinate phosphoribosyltransferase [Anaerolineaceae bacterium]
MTVFDHKRITNQQIKLDVKGLRRGVYSDQYFANVVQILEGVSSDLGDMPVEAQYFNRRQPRTLVAGVDVALAILKHATGYFEGNQFVDTSAQLDVEAVADGVFTTYAGNPMEVQPVIKVRGRYRDFALLETAMLGVLTRASRVATNVYHVLEVSNGKPILFFPARFDLPDVQAIDGYAYWLAVQRYNHDFNQQMNALVSTDAQGAWWGGEGGGTVPHALISSFLGDTADAMVAYARHVPVEVPRIALVDFNNDTVAASLAILDAYWPYYRAALESGDAESRGRWTLHGVRIDTSSNVRDVSLEPDGPYGINPQLIHLVRDSMDAAWERWNVPQAWVDEAKAFCRQVKIVASGGFDRARIENYERENVPVDMYGVGSRFFQNDSSTSTDYSMDIVRVKPGDQWIKMAKVGRQPCDNSDLEPVDLSMLE